MTPEFWIEDPFAARYELRVRMQEIQTNPGLYLNGEFEQCMKEMADLSSYMRQRYSAEELANIMRLLDIKSAATGQLATSETNLDLRVVSVPSGVLPEQFAA
jgi:hypothetical protein